MALAKVALLNLSRRMSRTLLALLGVVIGIAALTVLIALVDGINHDATETIGKLQGIFVYDESIPDPIMGTISSNYESKLKSIPGVKRVVPEIYHMVGKIEGKAPNEGLMNSPFLYGVAPKNLDNCSYSSMIGEIVRGRELKQSDKDKIIVTEDFADSHNKTVSSSIEIDGTKYQIVGIFEFSSSMGGNPVIGTFDYVRDAYEIEHDKVSSFYIEPVNQSASPRLVKLIEFKFDELQAQGQQDMMEQMGDLLDNLKILALVVSIISAIVAGIGVINTMLMSVMERVKEIGTLKAVGWTKKDIVTMIMLESLFIGIIGSILGLLVGYLISSAFTSYAGFTTIITLTLVIQNFVFGVFLGLFGGIYPAYVASKLDPIDALRS